MAIDPQDGETIVTGGMTPVPLAQFPKGRTADDVGPTIRYSAEATFHVNWWSMKIISSNHDENSLSHQKKSETARCDRRWIGYH
jgi:hypothetical protein